MTTDTTPTPPLVAGQKLGGAYVLGKALDTGGDQVVWLAEDEVLGKEVSLHFLPAAVAKDAQAIEEIRQEVKHNRPLIHPNILRVYDLVEGEGWAALATDGFSGRRLSAILGETKRFEVPQIEDWLDQVCVALEEAHRMKVMHLDVSPENIFVTPGGRLVLANFGTSRAVLQSLQRAGVLGTESARWSSTSPQVLDGLAPVPADDVYGTGALLYELLAGQPVFAGGDVPAKIRGTTPPRVSEVRDEADQAGEPIPPGWDNVIAACLNKNRDERPGSPAEIVSSIEAYGPVAPLATEAPAPSAVEAEAEAPEPQATIPKGDEIESEAEALVDHDPAKLAAPFVLSTADPAEAETAGAIEPNESVDSESPAAAEEESLNSVPSETQTESVVASSRPNPAAPPAPPRPTHFYDVDEDAFSKILPRRFRFPAAVAAAVILVLALVNGAFKRNSETPASPTPIATTDPSDRSELTPVKNSALEPVNVPAKDPAENLPKAPVPTATAKASPAPELLVAAGPTPKAQPMIPPGAEASSVKSLTDKAAALEKLKADLADAEKAAQSRAKDQQAADAALIDAQKAADAKTAAAAAARKEAEALVAARKQREDDQKAAELAAQAAQQMAAEKSKAADDARKALKDFDAKNGDRLATKEKSDSELQAAQRIIADRKKAAEEIAKNAAAAELARQQKVAAVQQAEQDLQTARANAAKNAEAEQRKQVVDSEKQKLDAEIASMRALFETKMKDIEDRRRQLEGAAPVAPALLPTAAPTPAATPVPRPPAAVVVPTPAPVVAVVPPPVPALPLMASRVEPAPVPPTPVAPPPLPAVPGGNSLGMRFAPVGDVQFCVWQTRVKDFETFAKAVNLKSTAWRGPGFRQGPDHPVVNVTWNEAIAFCKWLTDKEHKEGTLPASQFYRLPYDLEWSKAVGLPDENGKTPEMRDMGVPDVYPWGTEWPPPKGAGNYTGEETGSDVAIKGYDDGFAWTSPVGSFPPNKLGLFDMGGNVWQWCMDTWNADSKARVLRGASWYNGALKLSLLASCRIHAAPDSSTDNYGFRIVRATEAASAKAAKK